MPNRDVPDPVVAVLRGGPSSEHEISLLSGRAVLGALREVGRPVLDVVIGLDARWSIDGGAPLSLSAALDRLKERASIVFPALHGPFGEDGVLQGALEAAQIRFVGSRVTAASLAMDKLLSRRIASSLSIAVAPAVEVSPRVAHERMEAIVAEVRANSGPPWYVKPNAAGSSVGVSRVTDPAELPEAIRRALGEGELALIESGVSGTEVSCPVLGDAHRDARALPVIEIVPKTHAFFDYEAKYTEGMTDEICPARIPVAVSDALRQAALRLHETFGCRALSRSDFILTAGGGFVFLEINTLPGLTPVSLFPKAVAAEGMTYGAFIDGLIERALRRDEDATP